MNGYREIQPVLRRSLQTVLRTCGKQLNPARSSSVFWRCWSWQYPPQLTRNRFASGNQRDIWPQQAAQRFSCKRVVGATQHQGIDLARP